MFRLSVVGTNAPSNDRVYLEGAEYSAYEMNRRTQWLVPHLGVEGGGGSGGGRVGEGAVGEAGGQLRGVEGVGGPGVRRRWDQCRSRQVICSDNVETRAVGGGEKACGSAYSHVRMSCVGYI